MSKSLIVADKETGNHRRDGKTETMCLPANNQANVNMSGVGKLEVNCNLEAV